MKIKNVEISPDVMNAACSVAKSIEDVRELSKTSIGAVAVGSITVAARKGNPEPRWYIGDSYALNSFGMPNGGIKFYKENLPEMITITHESGKKFVLSVAGFNTAEYVQLAELADIAGVDIVELNLGCPNVSIDGKQKPIASFDRDYIQEIIREVSKVTDIPLLLKLSPYSNPSELQAVAKVIAKTGKVSGVVTANTFANSFTSKTGEPVLASAYGGLSGRALQPIALGQVRQFRQHLPEDIAVIGVGGIESPEDVKAFRQAGATGIQAATLIVRDGHSAIESLVK